VPLARSVHPQPAMTEENQAPMVSELEEIRDELKLQLHLAGMELKKSYDDLQNRLELFEERVRQRHPEEDLKHAFRDLKAAFQKLRDAWPSG
jgi:hypothetical protein